MVIPEKTKTGITVLTSIQLLSAQWKESTLAYNRNTCTSMFTASLFTAAMLWNQLRPTTTDVIKNRFKSFAGKWTELDITVLSKISQTHKDKYHIFFLICRI
jgi:hypothetical protein